MTESGVSSQLLFAQNWAVRLGATLLAAIALAVVLGRWDRVHRAQLETKAEMTAVGDGKFLQPPANAKALPVTRTTFNGRPVTVSWTPKIEVRDTHVRRMAVDAASGLVMYELSAAATEEERARATKHAGDVFLKVAPGEYVGARVAWQ